MKYIDENNFLIGEVVSVIGRRLPWAVLWGGRYARSDRYGNKQLVSFFANEFNAQYAITRRHREEAS